MTNQELAKIFFEMAELLEMEEVEFKPRAYEKAGHSLEVLEEDINLFYKKGGIKALESIPAVGRGIAERIEEYLKTGKIKDYEKLKKKTPINIFELSAIEGVGPKIIKVLYKKLGIKNIKDLEKSAKAGKLRNLPRFGEKLEQKILKSIKFYKKSHQRFILSDVLPLAESIGSRLSKIKGVQKLEFAGSLRRRMETIGDIDILIVSDNPKTAMKIFVEMPEVEYIHAKGLTKSSVRLNTGIDADLRIVPEQSFGAAWQYFTGNKDHNIALRKIAMRNDYKLNEYALFKGKKQIAGRTEEEIYKKLGLEWMPPEIRENQGEIEAGQTKTLPNLIKISNLKGDLQVQTNWTDGANSIEEMAKEAEKLGYEYIVITDHTRSLAMTGGLDEKKLLRQSKEIEKINKILNVSGSRFHVFTGAEVNILKDGSLDIKDEVLGKLDFVGAAIHSNFHLSKKEQTKRLIKAIENPNIDIIFHPTTRVIQKRPEIELDMEEIFKQAKKTGTLLEINAYPDRLDLKDEYARRAKEMGVKFAINTDAHSISHLHLMEHGIFQARRGWVEKDDVINTYPLSKFLEFIKKPKNKRF
ncbi:MAG: PHP domain protein [Parcubacteria group bacterium GW2011_GWC2_42_13]|nr:MAG: PHP domain protein [Parcubacteria group bacterium GW2011_GWC2_42_13]